ncbi:toxin-antitoxin system HicB family antitoxin, partial [Salipiger sp. 1_MG-2023]|uniref:toxin-antitoxin system HicB family antitoxin n=1 Tax=Salipiger sp. 1_MG-2023 TaxID=3062665 RepID=UPI0034C5CCE1
MREKKTSQINLRISPSLKEAADRAAAADQRSLTSLIEKLLTDHLRKTGFLGEPDSSADR